MILVFRLMMLVSIVLLLLFCMSNLDAVTVKLLGWESPGMPLFLLLLFVFFFGFFLALVWQAWNNFGSGKPMYDSAPKPAKQKKEKSTRKWGRKKKIESADKAEDKPPEETEDAESSDAESENSVTVDSKNDPVDSNK